MTITSLYNTHTIICKVPQSSSEFQTLIQPQRPVRFSNASKEGHLLLDWETAQGFHHEANGDFKTLTEFNGCDMRKLRRDQQHCSYSTIQT